jgi:hypothetical protein
MSGRSGYIMKSVRHIACVIAVFATLLLAQAVAHAHHDGPAHPDNKCAICLVSHCSPVDLPDTCDIVPSLELSERVAYATGSRPDTITALRASERAPPMVGN